MGSSRTSKPRIVDVRLYRNARKRTRTNPSYPRPKQPEAFSQLDHRKSRVRQPKTLRALTARVQRQLGKVAQQRVHVNATERAEFRASSLLVRASLGGHAGRSCAMPV